jgi:hypothetical protein
MISFIAEVRDVNYSPYIKFRCPFCKGTIGFYSTIIDNVCKICSKPLPFDPRNMVKPPPDERVEYHVDNC